MMPWYAYEPEIPARQREGGELHPDLRGHDRAATEALGELLGELRRLEFEVK